MGRNQGNMNGDHPKLVLGQLYGCSGWASTLSNWASMGLLESPTQEWHSIMMPSLNFGFWHSKMLSELSKKIAQKQNSLKRFHQSHSAFKLYAAVVSNSTQRFRNSTTISDQVKPDGTTSNTHQFNHLRGA